jgi:hypothetical protein
VNQSQAQNVVLAVGIVTGAVVAKDSFKKTGAATPPVKDAVAFLTLLAVLLVGAQVAPSIAGPFAILIGLAVIVSRLPSGVKK